MCAFHVFHKTQETLETAFLDGWTGQGYLYPVPLANRGVGNVRFYQYFDVQHEIWWLFLMELLNIFKEGLYSYIEYFQYPMPIHGSSQLDENMFHSKKFTAGCCGIEPQKNKAERQCKVAMPA